MLTKDAFKALELIEAVSSTNAKKSYLVEQRDNNVLRCFLYWAYNPFYRFNVRKFDYEANDHVDESGYKAHVFEFRKLLSKLNARVLTGNAALEEISAFVSKCDVVEQKWYSRIITKDLRSGINTETINKVFEGLIPYFPVALADKMPEVVYPKRFRVEDKFDGYRCLTFVNPDGTVEMYSRNGNQLFGYDTILAEMSTMERGYVYDGELLSHNFKGTQSTAFKKAAGKQAEYHVFDVLSIHDFLYGTGGAILKYREQDLDRIFSKHGRKLTCIKRVEPLYVSKRDEVVDEELLAKMDKVFLDAVSRGLEGVVIKDLNSRYMIGKTYSSACEDVKYFAWQKRKPRDLLDLKVIGIHSGTGQFADVMGSVTVEYIGSDGKAYEVDVGSGFSKSDRHYYWKHKNEIIGKTIKVATDGESSDASGALSLRFPVFKGVRSDK